MVVEYLSADMLYSHPRSGSKALRIAAIRLFAEELVPHFVPEVWHLSQLNIALRCLALLLTLLVDDRSPRMRSRLCTVVHGSNVFPECFQPYGISSLTITINTRPLRDSYIFTSIFGPLYYCTVHCVLRSHVLLSLLNGRYNGVIARGGKLNKGQASQVRTMSKYGRITITAYALSKTKRL